MRIPFSSLARGALRRGAALPIRLLDSGMRAEVLEKITEDMISDVPIGGHNLRFFTPRKLLRWRAKNALSKEPDMIHWIDGFSNGSVFWDIGANVGVFSLYAAAQRECKVLAFEPAAANFYVLARNIALNRLAQRVDTYCVALSGATGLGVLNLASKDMGAALHTFGRAGERSRYTSATAASHGMLGFTVDQFIEQFDPPFPTYMKIDVDGLEPQIIKGARRTLADDRLRAIMIELSLTNEAERAQSIRAMIQGGLRYVSQGESQGETERGANHLFLR